MSLLRRFVMSSWNTASTTTTASTCSSGSAWNRTAPRFLRSPLSWLQPPTLTVARFFASKKHKALLKHSKGFRGRSKNCYSIAVRRVEKSWQYGYRDRKRKRREYKKVWIQRISAGVRQYAFRYSEFMNLLYKNPPQIQLNRKVLAELAATEPFAFKAVVDVVQESTGIYKEPAHYCPDEGWDFDQEERDLEGQDDYYYDPETSEWLPTPKKAKKQQKS